jgi:flagellar hook-associated protein 1 FlgK
MSFQALNIAASSLRSQQKAMDVVSHNIANVNTAGYSRQTPNIVTATPESIGGLDFGRGINLKSVGRAVDSLISSSQRENASQFSFWKQVLSGLTTIENNFGSLDNTGLAASVNDFFASWQQLSNNPQDTAQKYNVRTKTNTLITQLATMQNQLKHGQTQLDQSISQQIKNANLALDEIAALSQQIKAHEAGKQGNSSIANDLRDQRDTAIRNLAAIIPIQEVKTQDGGILLQTKGGDLLAQDGVARHLARSSISSSGYQGIIIAGTNQQVQGLDSGGSLGGIIKLRDEYYQNYLDTLDSFSSNLAFATNQIQSSASSPTRLSQVQSGQGASNPALALNDTAQLVPFANKVQAGSFSIHIYDSTGAPLTPNSRATITITATTTMNDVTAALNAVTGISATVDAAGRLNIDAGTNTVAFADDTSNFLAAYEINSFFHGSTAGNLTLAQHIQNDVTTIGTGYTDAATSLLQAGDQRAAAAMLQLQDSAISVDGSTAASLHDRIASLSSQYGLDVGLASQQKDYRAAEASSLTQQREAISGVNVDEELIAMLKFQRAYEASAKIISTNNQMLDSLMGILR